MKMSYIVSGSTMKVFSPMTPQERLVPNKVMWILVRTKENEYGQKIGTLFSSPVDNKCNTLRM